jgi:predicted ATPase
MIIDKLREKIQDINIQDKIKKIIETIKNNFIFSKTHNSLLVKIEDLANDFIDNYHDIINFKESTDYGLNSHNDIILFEFFPKMSSGEEQFLRLFSALYEKFKKKFPYLICIDEGESFFHPNWQKQYTFYLINFFKDNFPNRKIHIILASHSPFLLSDIPKQNIIFLDTYTEEDIEVREEKQKIGNCKVLPHDKVLSIKQTFGANIHTLLTDSFFMEGGLMGEFAKQKINEIIKNLKDKEYRYTEKEKTKVLLIIESIGEPFLKSKLLDMYNRRFIDDYKIREQKRIDEQIRALQEKREQLK